jgi:diguanylate cyclase (GGDEF)-like protein
VPFSPAAPTHLAAVLGIGGILVGGALVFWAGERVREPVRHLLLAFATLAMTFCILASATPTGRVVTSYSYVWVAIYSAWFHRRWVAAAHIAAIAAGFGLALVLSHAPAPFQTWSFVMCSVAGVAAVLNTLVNRLRDLADRDQLTGLLTRRAFTTAAERAMAVAQRSAEPLTVALIDMNDFKLVNDLSGHAAGDALLAGTATAWRGAMRRSDILGRHGGDEFVLLMPAVTETESSVVLQRLRDASPTCFWTAGAAQWRGEEFCVWLERADQQLYANKRCHRAASDLDDATQLAPAGLAR